MPGIAIVRCDRQRPGNGSGLVNRTVCIGGKLWFCTRVNRDHPNGPILPGEAIYLWVREAGAAR
jgi:hypothetical protein